MGFLTAASAEEALHARIDQMLEAGQIAGQAPIATDADFLRRACLALHGVIPTAAQARAFFADTAPDKRAKLIDSLIADPQFARWMATRFDLMLMERRPGKHVKAPEWQAYLEASFLANKPWNVLAQELIANDGSDEKTRAAARWCLEREADPNALAKDASRMFLGRDLACAQCHDHPKIDDYTQREYHGLFAFFSRTHLFQPDEKKPALLGERAAGEATYTSVFTKLGGGTKPRLVGGAEIAEPAIAPAEQWAVPPNDKDKNVRAIPKYSRRLELAKAFAEGNNAAFRQNIANRLWHVVFGRGLVEPLDLHHSGNPPAHPELLALLGESMAAMKFDMKAFTRELALTRAFQRSLDLPDQTPKPEAIAQKVPEFEKQIEALNGALSAAQKEFAAAEDALKTSQKAAQPVNAEWQKENTATAAAQKSMGDAQAATKKAEDALVARREAQKALAEAAAKVNEAAAKIPEAADLGAAAKTFQTKADEAVAAIPQMEKDAAAKKAEVEKRQQALTAAQQTLAAAKAKLDEAEKNVAVQQAALDAVAARQQAERLKAKHAALRLAEVRAALAWVAADAADRPHREAAAKAEAGLSEIRQKVDALTAELNGAPARLVMLEGEAATALETSTKAQGSITAKQPALATLDEAAAKSAEAAAKLNGDAAVAAAAAAVKAKADALRADYAKLEKAAIDAKARAESAARQVQDFRARMEKIQPELAAAQAQLPALESAAKDARAKAQETAGPALQAREALATAWSRSFAVAELGALLPEQLCWSVMQATGILGDLRAQAGKEWDDKNKLSDADKANPAKQAERAAAVEKAFREKVRPHEDQYVRSFGGAAGHPQTDFFATPEQALYFENGGVLRSWAASLASRIAALPEPKAEAEELYLSVLTRMPAESEIAEFSSALGTRPPEKKNEAITDYAWALVTSAEFRFSH